MRTNEKLARENRYSFLKEADKALVTQGTTELENAMNLPSAQVQQNRAYFEGLINAWNHESDEQFSYLIDAESSFDQNRLDREPKIIKVDHPGRPARVMSQLATDSGMSDLDFLIKGGFVDTAPMVEEAPAETQDTASEGTEETGNTP